MSDPLSSRPDEGRARGGVSPRQRSVPVGLVLLSFACGAGASTARQATDATGVRAGLAVVLGSTDGRLEAELAATGAFVVHGLAPDAKALAAARAELERAGLHGAAAIELAAADAALPYADNLVNLLVIDLDRPGAKAPHEAELMRALAPGGALYVRRRGRWQVKRKDWPEGLDDWPHFDYGADGNGVSRDTRVAPPRFLQWISGEQFIMDKGHPSQRVGNRAGVRIARGRAYYLWQEDPKGRTQVLAARDAFSGVPLWNVKLGYASSSQRFHIAALGDRVYTFLRDGAPLVALDGANGDVALTYDRGGRLPAKLRHLAAFRVTKTLLVQAVERTVYALDTGTGRLLWKHEEPNGVVIAPSVSVELGRVFLAVDGGRMEFTRWPWSRVHSVLCLDLESGREVWRNTEISGNQVGQLVASGETLAVFGSGAIGGGKEPTIAAMRVRDGTLLFNNTFKKDYNRFGYNMLVRDGTLYYADAWRIYAVDLGTGTETRVFDSGGYNMRCNRFSATPNYLLYGFGAMVDRVFQGTIRHITRSGCAIGAFPAHGLIYYGPNGCGCIPRQIRGQVALSPEALRRPVPDAERVSGEGATTSRAPATSTAAGLIAADWRGAGTGLAADGEAVRGLDRIYSALTHQHQLVCREGEGGEGRVRWVFTAGGRISGRPLLEGGLCYFGAHDGYVYAVGEDTGKLAWRFQAEPYARRIVAYGQVESSWPVYGVVLHRGAVCASAGRHPELGGGIHVWGLRPRDGRPVWHRVITKRQYTYRANRPRNVRIRPNVLLNAPLQSDGEALILPGLRFTPEEPDEAIEKRLEAERKRR